MFSFEKFLIVGSDDKSVYIRSDDGKQTYTISAFNVTRSFVSNNILKIKEKGTDFVLDLPFSSNLEARRSLKKFWDQIEIIREKVPHIYDKAVKNVIENGIMGLQGFQGIIGFQGFQGLGTTGVQGQGLQGLYGSTGNQGLQGMGIQGFQGLGMDGVQGTIGQTGIQGNQGFQGLYGSTGNQGNQGLQGVGIQGMIGQTGIQGNQGFQGLYGSTGNQGNQGLQGVGIQGGQGIIGITGSQGLVGQDGIQGFQGIIGSSGEQGLQGVDGFQGFIGDIGFQGFQGPDPGVSMLNSGVPYNLGTGLPLDQDGHFRMNSILADFVTEIYISISDHDSIDQSLWLQNISGGFIYIWKTSTGITNTPSQVIYKVNSTVWNTTYLTLNVTWISGTIPASSSLCYLLTENTFGGPQGAHGQVGGWTFEYQIDSNFIFNFGRVSTDSDNFLAISKVLISAYDIYNNDLSAGNTTFTSLNDWLRGSRLFFKIFDINDSSKCWFYYSDIYDVIVDGFDISCTYIGGNNSFPTVSDFSHVGISLQPNRQGSDGLQGFDGVQGFQGIQGRQGFQGSQGFQGLQGRQGITGFQGFQGRQGFQGNQGFQGRQGVTGVQGFQGFQGSGSTGVQGETGVQGFQGATGSISIANDPGEQTYTGTASITFTAGTQPSGATNHRYFWTRVGNCVQWTMILNWATGGTTVTVCSFALPTDMPSPVIPTGLSGASAHHYGATVRVATSITAAVTQGACTLRRNAGDTGEQVTGSFTSGSWRLFILFSI